ncbi:MAG: 3-deoxy-manno-octulosonate-8-phosphatase KdsC [Pseudomonadota bacterium]
MYAILPKAKPIRLLILDVDGVLTNGQLFFDNKGEEYKLFHVRDGHGIKLLQQTGVIVAVMSGRYSAIVTQRLQQLGIKYLYQNVENKRLLFQQLLIELNITAEQTAYVGDDWIDLPVMTQVGLAIAVQDAHHEVKTIAHYVTQQAGGLGAVREVCDLIMQAQQTFTPLLARYLS